MLALTVSAALGAAQLADKHGKPGSKVPFKSTPVVTLLDNSLLATLRVRVCSDLGERAASASAFQPYSCDASTAAGTSVLQHEGEDESSHNDTVSLHWHTQP